MNALLMLALIFCSYSCVKLVDHVYGIRIENHSADTIQFYGSYNYPDTNLSDNKPRLKMVYPSEYTRLDSKKKWEEVFADLPADTLSIFIFSGDTIVKYNWQQIRRDYNILARKDISIDDLKNNNWTVTYP